MQNGYGQETWALWGEVSPSRAWRDSISGYDRTSKSKSMQALLGKGVAIRISRILVTKACEGDGDCVCQREVFAHGELGRWDREGNLQAPGRMPWP